MKTNMLSLAGRLSNHELLAQVKLLTQQEREATAVLIAHLAIFDERDLYLAEGCSSMFTYCVDVLHLSEHAAYGRIEAARAARKYPIILNLLSDGSVNLTTVTLLAPHLTAENHLKLLTAAKHQRKRQVEELVAGVRPQPDVPSTIRRLPTPTNDPVVDALIAGDGLGLDPRDAPPPALPAPAANARPAVVTPLAPERYKVQFTAHAGTHAKLRMAQELLRHQVPDGDLGQVIDRALTALLRDLMRQKFAATNRPRQSSSDRPGESSSDQLPGAGDSVSRSRHIAAEVRRAVWKRDGGQCAFVAHNGRRCGDRAFLEFHHVVPYSAGGEATLENIQLRCRAHNGFETELSFGQGAVLRRGRASAQSRNVIVNSVRTELRVEPEAALSPLQAGPYRLDIGS
jgi:hypothetical protein